MGRKDVAYTILEIVLKTNTEGTMYCIKYTYFTKLNHCTPQVTIVTTQVCTKHMETENNKCLLFIWTDSSHSSYRKCLVSLSYFKFVCTHQTIFGMRH